MRGPDGEPASGIMVLCTANICRSPMAAALLTRRLQALGVALPVRSAGMLDSGRPPLPEAVAAAAAHGLDISAHRSRTVTASDLADAGLVLAMACEHIRQAVVAAPGVWPRAFTLKELVRRGELTGPRPEGESLGQWLSRVHAGRDRASLLGDSPEDDVPDPASGPWQGYLDAASVIDRLVSRLCELGWGHRDARPQD